MSRIKIPQYEFFTLSKALAPHGATSLVISKPIPFEYILRQFSLNVDSSYASYVFCRIYFGSAGTTNPDTDPSAVRIDSEYSNDWGICAERYQAPFDLKYPIYQQNKCLMIWIKNTHSAGDMNTSGHFVIERLLPNH